MALGILSINKSTPVASPISNIPSPAPYSNDQTLVPDISETATTSSLTQEAAVDLVKTWLQEKNKVLAPPFDLQVLARYTTGRYFRKSQKMVGAAMFSVRTFSLGRWSQVVD